MANLTIGKSRIFFVVALAVVTTAALFSPDAWGTIVEYFRGGGGLDLFTP